MSQIESTYKARDVEETIDIFFYRPIGYVVAQLCRRLRITPNIVTVCSILIGVAAGHLLYYPDIIINTAALLLWVIADILDSVDGQLARLINHKSRFGRILDGVATYIIFTSIYLHLYLRMVNFGGSPWLILLVLASIASHAMQSSIADYFRHAYLKFVVDPAKSELEYSEHIRIEYEELSFKSQLIRKLFLGIYLNYTVQQEFLSKNFQALRKTVEREYGQGIPSWLSDEYRFLNKPLMKYYAILTTNTRAIIMASCVLMDKILLYFIAEVVFINLVMVAVVLFEEKFSAQLLRKIKEVKAAV